jgi:hypothetical protein
MPCSSSAAVSALSGILLVAAIAAASADVLYDQPGEVGERPAWTSTRDQFGLGFRTFDSFTLA